jgi:hypothetical protein
VAEAQYRFVGSHADQTDDGRPLFPGDFVELTDDQLHEPHVEQLAHDGMLLGINDEARHQLTLAHSRVQRRTTKAAPNDDELPTDDEIIARATENTRASKAESNRTVAPVPPTEGGSQP